ncbi:hypothetical protein BDW02DRAFT_595387 [Decorospora gaudefroyi]|uniref:Uncharacterized protein n=1 Tax=Decorospora gaudefroyi TaxID=184978 RepID=A0A6A5KN24_9PLEO|nr:hypothetical protein BDW02DRAFT_595387 [Decorospora gaudefroyi]
MFLQFDQARERTEKELSQTILDREVVISRIAPENTRSELLSLHHRWADKLHKAILSYAHAANMAVVVRVLNLPRELRDTIYTHLWDVEKECDPNRDLIYWWDSFQEPWFEKDENLRGSPWPTTSETGLRPPHFIDQEFVGSKFATEALKRFKDTVGKDLRQIGEKNPVAECPLIDGTVRDFVKKDMFGLGITMEYLVRNLDLRVNFQCDVLSGDEYAESQKSDAEELAEGGEANCAPENYLAELDEGLSPWLVIRQEYYFSARSHRASILKLVARAYHGLRDKGFILKVQYYSQEAGLKVLFEDDVWGWTSEDWAANLQRKNTYRIQGQNRVQRYQANIWEDLREHLFQPRDARGH